MSIDTIAIDEKHRIVIDYDSDSENPREWEEGVSVHPIVVNSSYHPPKPGDDTHGDLLSTILENTAESAWSGGYRLTEAAEAAIAKHFDRAGLAYQIVELSADRDWVGTFIWYLEGPAMREVSNPDVYLEGCVSTYRQWASGQVYYAAIEELIEWTAETSDGEGRSQVRWEPLDGIGGIYFEPDYSGASGSVEEQWITELRGAGLNIPEKTAV